MKLYYYVYVSPGGSDELSNGSINNPFKTIKHALNNKGIVMYWECNYTEDYITISKTLTLKGFKAVIADCKGSLFNISQLVH